MVELTPPLTPLLETLVLNVAELWCYAGHVGTGFGHEHLRSFMASSCRSKAQVSVSGKWEG